MGRSGKSEKSSRDKAFAKSRGLRYVCDLRPGFTRRRRGKSFHYFDLAGKRIKSARVLRRIRSLVIPPAWEEVWICPSFKGHIQATGRDARGRKQYRYHALWTTGRNQMKFRNLKQLCALLPPLRARVESDLHKSGLPKEKVIAAVVKLLEVTQIRVGNETYAEENDSYGLTTICNRHARVHGEKVRFCFRGKSGVRHEVCFRDPCISRIVHSCQKLPGRVLFRYVGDDGEIHSVDSNEVNQYMREASGGELTAKALRTWGGSVKALEILMKSGPCPELTEKERKAREREVIRQTAEHLHNTVAVCRKYYVHPLVFEADRQGKLPTRFRDRKDSWLSTEERALAALF